LVFLFFYKSGAPNQALPEGIPLGQADGCQLGALNMANISISLNNKLFSMNLFRWVHFESYQRRSLAPIR
jgi:hypothetical protein